MKIYRSDNRFTISMKCSVITNYDEENGIYEVNIT